MCPYYTADKPNCKPTFCHSIKKKMCYYKFMKIILGIGNPEEKYEQTRHNVGFMFADYLAKRVKADKYSLDKKLNSLITSGMLNSEKIIIIKPQTYVNKTGSAVSSILNYYKIKPDNLIVAHDDLDISSGQSKISFDKKSAGHNGVDSIIKSIKTKKFYRIRFGLASSALQRARKQKTLLEKKDKVAKFVLSKFSPSEKTKLTAEFKEAVQKIESNIFG